jgi:hypothetical protein
VRQAQVSVILALVMACSGNDPADPADPLDVRVFPAHVFAGGEVFLAGDWYQEIEQLPIIALDTFTLSVRRVDDSTLAATLPATENGALQLWERIDGEDVDRGLLQVHGFKRTALIPMLIEGEFTPSRNPALPYVITGDSAGVSVIDLRNDLVTRYPGIGRLRYEGSGCWRIAGPTYRDGTFLIWDPVSFPSHQATRWDLVPDTLRREPLFPAGCGGAEFSPQVFVQTGSEGVGAFVSIDSIDAAGNYTHFYDDIAIGNKGFFWAPGGNRLVLRAYEPPGAGVLDLQSRGLAYRVPSVRYVASAAFSMDGESILLCGQGPQGEEVLVRVDAASGDSLAGLSLRCRSIVTDPQLGLIYAVVVNDSPLQAQVAALDLFTLAEVGKIDLPNPCFYCMEGSILFVDRANLELIVLWSNILITGPGGVSLAHLSLPLAFPTARRGR